MNSKGHAVCEAAGELERWQLSATHIAKSFCFDLFFLSRAKSERFCGLHKNTQTFRLSPKPVLFIGFVGNSIFACSLEYIFQILFSDNRHYVHRIIIDFVVNTVRTANTSPIPFLNVFNRFK